VADRGRRRRRARPRELAHDPEHGPVRVDWLDRFTPVAKIGYSIYVYRFE
jgi:hypothetical protein